MADRTVVYRLRAETAQFKAQMAAAGASVRGAAAEMTGATKQGAAFRQGLSTVGKAAGAVGLAAGAGLAVVVTAAARFDQAMSRVQAATHESAANMDLLRVAAIKAGQDTKFSATEAADGIESLAKAGVSTKDILAGGLTGALNLAAAGNQSVGDAAETAASAMTQFKLSGSQIPHIADLLAAGAGKAQGEVSDLAMALNQAGLVASQTGLSIEETTAGLSSFASAGLIGSDAGTSFKTMLLRLTPTSAKAQTLMDKLNLSAYDSQGSFIGLANYAGVLHDRLKDMSDQQRNATLQTLFGQDAIRAANVLYQQGAKGIQSWTDKVNAQGYAAQTAAIKMDNLAGDLEQLRGSLETAFIGAGEGSQGPLRGLVQHLTQIVNAANAIPGPVKSAGSSLLALTAVAGGGLYFGSKVVAGMAAMRVAAQQLGFEVATTRAKLQLLGVAGGAAALGIGTLINTISEMDTFSRARDTADVTIKSFQDLADALQYSNIGKNADDLHINLARLSEDLAENGAQGEYVAQVMGDLQGSSHGFGALLNSELGHATLGQLGGSADKAGDSLNDLQTIIGKLPPELVDTAGATEDAAGATQSLGQQLGRTGANAAQMGKKLAAAKKDTRSAAQSFVGLGSNLDKAKVSLSEWIKSLQRQANALRDFRVNAVNAAKKGLDEGLIASLNKAGPAGALRMKQLGDATKTQIDAANKAWRSQQHQVAVSTNVIASLIAGIPNVHNTKLNLTGADAALHQAQLVADALNRLHDRTITLTTVRATGGHSVGGDAAGGTVPGQRQPYGDKVLRWLAPGEEVISNRHGQADRNRPLLKRINSGGMAEGGTVHSGSGGFGAEAAGATSRLHKMNHALDDATKSLDKEKQHRDDLVQAEKDLAKSVASNFRSDLFGQTSAFSGSTPASTLKMDIANARAFNKALHELARKGVHGAALAAVAQSGDLAGAQMLAAHPGDFQHLYQLRQRVTRGLGDYAGSAVVGSELHESNHHLKQLRAEVIHLRREVKGLRKDGPKNADRTGDRTAKAINHSAAQGHRRRPKHP